MTQLHLAKCNCVTALVSILDDRRGISSDISLQQYKTDMSFKELVEGVYENVFVISKYQRKYRWIKEQVERVMM